MKEYKNIFNKLPKAHPIINFPYTQDEIIHSAIKSIKNGKAAGKDGIYPDMITHLVPTAISWLTNLIETIKT